MDGRGPTCIREGKLTVIKISNGFSLSMEIDLRDCEIHPKYVLYKALHICFN